MWSWCIAKPSWFEACWAGWSFDGVNGYGVAEGGVSSH